jgi:hypothetical protein
MFPGPRLQLRLVGHGLINTQPQAYGRKPDEACKRLDLTPVSLGTLRGTVAELRAGGQSMEAY